MTEQRPADWQARAAALDPGRSLIVQAPAGSGKTELLTQRLLTLLGRARRPEEVLAITFTRKAANEMRLRLLETLEAAAADTPVESPHQQQSRALARQLLERDRQHDWQLLKNPARLQILTIDSLCASLVRRMPWLSRFGATPEIREDAKPLYRQAAGQVVDLLDSSSSGAGPVTTLLRHLDNRSDLLRDLLADMLGKRDQWLRHLLPQQTDRARQLLEQGLCAYIQNHLQRLAGMLPADFAAELAATLSFAAGNLAETAPKLHWFLHHRKLPPAEVDQLDCWQALAGLLLTQQGEVRKTVNKNQGFPAGKDERNQQQKQAMLQLLEQLREQPQLTTLLAELGQLPRPAYSEAEWRLLEALVQLLPQAVAQLELVFRGCGQCDFIAIAAAARSALGSGEAPEELLLQIDSSLQHILVDEFQDTSYGQYVLLQQLTAGWCAGDGRTLFVVGDPMQSIYRFREAEVGLFLRARRIGLHQLPLQPLQLTANFRSDGRLVDWFNRSFDSLFPMLEDEARGAVSFAAATPTKPAAATPVLSCRALTTRDDGTEAELVLEAVLSARQLRPDGTIGILVRSRSHASAIAPALAAAGLRYQARDIVPLADRVIIQDLRALTRALLQPADRVCWLALLRAPWCGQSLAELLQLVEDQSQATIVELLNRPQQPGLFQPETAAGSERLQRTTAALLQGLERRGRVPLRQLVESTWLNLCGPACCEAAELDDADQFFRLLEQLDGGGDLRSLDDLDRALDNLFAAPDPLADESLQLMTIHKSKGLEFDCVILPGLGRSVRGSDKPLLRWLEHPDFELLLAPIPAADGSGEGATYAAIGSLLKEKEELELVRLLYVAVTRARHQLVLFGHLQGNGDELKPPSGSLLAAGWRSLEPQFQLVEVNENAEDVATPPRLLRRLPESYRPPAWPEATDYSLQQSASASQTAHPQPDLILGRGDNYIARLVGEAVHSWFERYAGSPQLPQPQQRRTYLRRQLLQRGHPVGKLDQSLERSLQILATSCDGERGGWLLHPYGEQANELALTGWHEQQLLQAKIDRTFVDDDNVRWIIDYKTSKPEAQQPLDDFYRQQGERYADQLQNYRHLLQQLEPQRPIRTALYFPAFDGWLELD